jgi:hypothetical protein
MKNGVLKIIISCAITCLITSAITILVTYSSGIGSLRESQARETEKAAAIAIALEKHEQRSALEREELMGEIQGLRSDVKELSKAVWLTNAGR